MDEKIAKNIGQKIRQLRLDKGLTQKQLGDMCGIADSNIRKYETGRQNPKIDTLEKIAKALDIEITELILDDVLTLNLYKQLRCANNYKISITPSNTPLEQITAAFTKLNEKGQEKAASYVEDLTKIPEYKKTE